MNISKLIPFSVRIKTLYWVRKEKEIDSDLTELFALIDEDDYKQGRIKLELLVDKWTLFSQSSPKWFQLEYISQLSKAESMMNFLEYPLSNE